MRTVELHAFSFELEKLAMQPITQMGGLRASAAKLMKPRPTVLPKPGGFGIRTSLTKKAAGVVPPYRMPQHTQSPRPVAPDEPDKTRALNGKNYPRMDRAAWKQFAKDALPLAAGGALGYGVGRTLGDMYAREAVDGMRRGAPPGWMKSIPIGMAIAGVAAGYTSKKLHQLTLKRALGASAREKQAVAPAPQSRGIPRKKPTDPWRYDPRAAGWL